MSLYPKLDNLCNVCKKPGELSEDHVPPKGVLLDKVLYMDNYGKQFQRDDGRPRVRLSQNGVRFKTICRECNNSLSNYDRKLIEFSKDIILELGKNKGNPNYNEVELECYPNAIIRSVLGHLLSAKVETDQVKIDDEIRKFLFDESLPIPESVNIYYWFYPYPSVRIGRDFVCLFPDNKMGFNSVIKFPPIAFLITDLQNIRGLESLNSFKIVGPDSRHRVTLMLRPTQGEGWPEVVTGDTHFVAGGKSFSNSLVAVPKAIFKKKS